MSEENQSDIITIKKDSLWKYSTFLLLAIVIIGAFFYYTGDKVTTTGGVINDIPTQPTAPVAGAVVDVKTGDAPVLGSKNAQVTMVEFSDYECPFCGRHFEQTYPQLKKDYIDTGKVKLVFMNFPLSFHPEAQKAAEAALCVKEQKGDTGYFLMHDKMYSNQETLSVENEKKWAKELGVDSKKFDDCLDSGKMASKVKAEMNYGSTIGVQGTPAFFINGKLISGAQPYASFQQAIEAELA